MESQSQSWFAARQRVSKLGLAIATLLFGAWAMTLGLGCAPRTSPNETAASTAVDPSALDCSKATVAWRDLVEELYDSEGYGHGSKPVVIVPLPHGGELLLTGAAVTVIGTCVNSAGATLREQDWVTAAALGNWAEWARQGGRTPFAPAGRIAQVMITCRASEDPTACLPPPSP